MEMGVLEARVLVGELVWALVLETFRRTRQQGFHKMPPMQMDPCSGNQSRTAKETIPVATSNNKPHHHRMHALKMPKLQKHESGS